MIMTSVSGHLLDLDFHPDYRKWSVDLVYTVWMYSEVFNCLDLWARGLLYRDCHNYL